MHKALLIIIVTVWCLHLSAQTPTINAAYAKSLHQKYPSMKSDFCKSCKLWVNPYFKSIADTAEHAPRLTYYVYTREHRLAQEALKLPRSGTYAAWYPSYMQPNETNIYKYANKQIGKPGSMYMIAKGHCQSWILLAWCADAAILSDTYTFNAAMEYQGQNVGTQLETEERCRRLTGWKNEPGLTDSVKIWCGTFGSQKTYTQKTMSVSVPAYYYKMIEFRDRQNGQLVTECYWMPNQPEEKQDLLPKRKLSYADLLAKLGFDPKAIFN